MVNDDGHGHVQGEGDPASAGVIFNLASQASSLEQGEEPVLQIQTETQ